jgi:CheY-like chemotaxis protein
MPELDGFEVTAVIRADEGLRGRRVPIVAMTAHATPGYRERCFAVGMDGYLMKPLVVRDLLEIVARISAERGRPPATVPPEHPLPSAPTWSQEAALTLVEGDRGLLSDIVTVFLEAARREMAAIRQALDSSDPAGLARAAHALKGAAAAMAAPAAAEAALRLEERGRAIDLAGATTALAHLEREINRLTGELLAAASDTLASP